MSRGPPANLHLHVILGTNRYLRRCWAELINIDELILAGRSDETS